MEKLQKKLLKKLNHMGNSIIDIIIRIQNGYMSGKPSITSPHSIYKEDVLKKLKQLSYIKDYIVEGEVIKNMTVELLYPDNSPAITGIKIVSTPGKRMYVSYKKLKPIVNNYGFSILSTSKGIMTNQEARKAKLGGE